MGEGFGTCEVFSRTPSNHRTDLGLLVCAGRTHHVRYRNRLCHHAKVHDTNDYLRAGVLKRRMLR